jgi:hypothetical protein
VPNQTGEVKTTRWRIFDAVLAVTVLSAFGSVFLWCAVLSVDFGTHWDEGNIIRSVQSTLNTGIILPGWYNYPSLTYLVALSTALAKSPVLIGAEFHLLRSAGVRAQLAEYAGSQQFNHLLRIVFAVLTASSAIFVLAAARLAGTSWLSAAVGGAVVLASFQVFYHGRWIAPDTLLMLAGSMTIAAALWAVRDRRLLPLSLAAVSAGLATAAKYPGGCLIILPLIAAMRGSASTHRVVQVLGLFIVTYLLVTPGTLVDPARFARDVLYEIKHYGQYGHGGNTIEAGIPHLAAILDFLIFRIASSNAALSTAVLAAALTGAAVVWGKNRRIAAMLITVPAIYIALMSINRVMIVRNHLVLVPFVAVLVAIALDAFVKLFPSRVAQSTIALAAAGLLTLNWQNLLHAKSSLEDLDIQSWRLSVSSYLKMHKGKRFSASPRVSALFEHSEFPSMTFYPPEQADTYLYVLGEHKYYNPTPSAITNRRNVYRVVAGPDDVDLDYYPNWSGLERIIAIDAPAARTLTGKAFAKGTR